MYARTLSHTPKNSGSIKDRIENIQALLDSTKLKSFVNFNSVLTECYVSRVHKNLVVDTDSESDQTYNTRQLLGKCVYNFNSAIGQFGDELRYVASGTTGHTFYGNSILPNGKKYQYAVKVVAYAKEKYGNVTKLSRPENAELVMIKLLSYFVVKNFTPHIVLPITIFDTNIQPFIDFAKNLDEDTHDNNFNRYRDFVQSYREGKFYNTVSILVSEWSNRGDLLKFIRNNYETMTPLFWKCIIFQIFSVLALIQLRYPSFRHNDLKANNILLSEIATRTKPHVSYIIDGNRFEIPNNKYIIKIWDFDFACIPGIVDNDKVDIEWTRKINVTKSQNRYYDIHYFFNTLLMLCREQVESDFFPPELLAFIYRVVPKRYRFDHKKRRTRSYVHLKGRLLANEEYVTPLELLKTDEYFAEFRVTDHT